IPAQSRRTEAAIVRSSSAQKSAAELCAPTASVQPLQIRGRFLTAVVLPVPSALDEAFEAGLDAALQQSPRFFADAPLVVDLAGAGEMETEEAFNELLALLKARRLSPIGIQNATAHQTVAAARHGLITLKPGKDTPFEQQRAQPAANRPVAVPDPEPAPAASPAADPVPAVREPMGTGLTITEPVRSGQCIVAEEGDLTVLASVSSGAELIAPGHIHVYGALRGRALAGVGGDTRARIFCQSLEAELIAIAGLYKTSEAFEPAVAKQRVHAFLEADTLRLQPLR
ncbi:MAG: septum site-determining protein MinC, partial [Pseudomonadota bacterium]